MEEHDMSRRSGAKPSMDPLAFSIGRVKTHLVWIDEHYREFKKLRSSDPVRAEKEFESIAGDIQDAFRDLRRVIELVLDGRSIDPTHRIPTGLREWLERTRQFHGDESRASGSSDPNIETE